jgi:HD-GYP domain-containing protein (c-di-GMP phosphodiesterase class II)
MRRLEEESLLRTVRTLAAAVDARDACTHSHSRNVATFSVALARHIGLPEERVRRIEMAALLHDVGKIGIRDSVLTKKDDLDRFEFEMVREHPVLGEKILRSTAAQDILPWVLHHHERWDGNGYPAGLAGNSIPFEARIIALCDAYDAMRSDRPYREGISEAGALLELATTAGGQFDPELTRAFMEVVRSGEVAPPLEHRVEVE